jgi:ABC-type multidrug transport system fused ATPase/permease subunit
MKMSLRDGLKLSLSLLTKRDQKLLFLAFLVQISLSVLDLIGIGAIAAVVAIAVSVIQNVEIPSAIKSVLSFFGQGDLSAYNSVIALSIAAAVLFSSKTLVTALITKRQFTFLANRDALASTKLMQEFVNHSILTIQARPAQETISALTAGVTSATTNFLGNLIIVSSEGSLLLIVSIALLLNSPAVAICAILLFGVVGVILHKILGNVAQDMGRENNTQAVAQAAAIQTTISAYRELSVMNRQDFFNAEFARARWRGAHLSANGLFLGQISRYVFELTLVLGAFALAASQFIFNDAVTAITTLSVFLAAGTRLLPSLLRLQTGLVIMKGSLGGSQLMVDLRKRLDQTPINFTMNSDRSRQSVRNNASVAYSLNLNDVTFIYPTNEKPALRHINLQVDSGKTLGLIGRSGSGKSTLVDLILGVLIPNSGDILINGMDPIKARQNFVGSISYVPQDITLISGNIEANVALGLNKDQYEIEWIWESLEAAQLADFVKSLPEQLNTEVGERGVRLSGGQRQRIGLARALLSQPSLLILDEATSALDMETESEITSALAQIKHPITKIVIAHRLGTVQHLDRICILDEGEIRATGVFSDLAKDFPFMTEYLV